MLQSLDLYASIIDPDNQDGTVYRRLSGGWRELYRNLSLVFPILTSTLNSIRNLLPFPDSGSLAYVFADEAGTTGIHQLFPALVRAKKALVVGDPLQLQPVMNLSKEMVERYYETAFVAQGLTDENYDLYSPSAYEATSAYQRAAGVQGTCFGKGKGIVLIDHFRCSPPIAAISNALGEYGLVIKTRPITPVLGTHLIATDIRGSQENMVNFGEIEAVVEWVRILYSHGYSFGSKNVEKSIGVLSPYRKQANALRRALQAEYPDCNEDNTNTIHTFQGGEKAIVLLSTRQSQPSDTLMFLNRGPNLLNVGVSRAIESLILVGNLERLRGGVYSRIVVEHIERHGQIRVPGN
ncbi:AAA domain-containing protein [Leptolyngbya sp. GB1-A1]|uniref:DEAD/DEAH box helicase n=1 Tax=Leptolyngbya sp. GB1-A1 TaxID=2933908 RepID=UPI003298B3B5